MNDAAFVQSLYGDDRVTRRLFQIQGPLTMAEAVEFCSPSHAASGDHRLGVSLQPGGELIAVGSVRLHADRPEVATIGISVLPAFWSQGLGAELAGLLVRFATIKGASEIHATTRDDNLASQRVLEKLDFQSVEVGVPEVDSRGDTHPVTRWVLSVRSRT